jgi:hypothetical protein
MRTDLDVAVSALADEYDDEAEALVHLAPLLQDGTWARERAARLMLMAHRMRIQYQIQTQEPGV